VGRYITRVAIGYALGGNAKGNGGGGNHSYIGGTGNSTRIKAGDDRKFPHEQGGRKIDFGSERRNKKT